LLRLRLRGTGRRALQHQGVDGRDSGSGSRNGIVGDVRVERGVDRRWSGQDGVDTPRGLGAGTGMADGFGVRKVLATGMREDVGLVAMVQSRMFITIRKHMVIIFRDLR